MSEITERGRVQFTDHFGVLARLEATEEPLDTLGRRIVLPAAVGRDELEAVGHHLRDADVVVGDAAIVADGQRVLGVASLVSQTRSIDGDLQAGSDDVDLSRGRPARFRVGRGRDVDRLRSTLDGVQTESHRAGFAGADRADFHDELLTA